MTYSFFTQLGIDAPNYDWALSLVKTLNDIADEEKIHDDYDKLCELVDSPEFAGDAILAHVAITDM